MNTKKTILLSAALLAPLGLLAHQTAEPDTIVVEQPQRVTVVTTDSLQHILVEGKEGNPKYTYSNTLQIVDSNYVSSTSINKGDFTLGFGWPKAAKSPTYVPSTYELTAHLLIGFVSGPGMPKPADVNTTQSTEWWFILDNEWRPWKNRRHFFSVGLGFDWRNWRMDDGYMFTKNDEGMNTIEQLPEGAKPKFSRIKVFSLNFPIRYQYQTRNFGFSLGPVVNFNTYASTKTRYKLNGSKYKEVDKKIHPTPITVDFMATLDTYWVSFYMKYSPCNVLKSDYGLKFKSLTVGVYF